MAHRCPELLQIIKPDHTLQPDWKHCENLSLKHFLKSKDVNPCAKILVQKIMMFELGRLEIFKENINICDK